MMYLMLLMLLSNQLAGLAVAAKEHAGNTATCGALLSNDSTVQWPAVDRGLSKQGEGTAAQLAMVGTNGRSLQQSGKPTGRVVGWGTIKIPNYVPSDVLQQGATDVAIIGSGLLRINTFLALLQNQSVVVWGDDATATIPKNGAANVTAIAANWFAAAVLLSNGSVASLMDDPTDISVPTVVQKEVDAIWAGASLFFARLRNGSLAVWDYSTPSTVNLLHPTSGSDHVVGVAAGLCLDVESPCWFTLRANGSVIPESVVSVVPEVLHSGVAAIASARIPFTGVFLALLRNGGIVQWTYASPDKLDSVQFPFNTTGMNFSSVAPPNWAVTTSGSVVTWDVFNVTNTSNAVPLTVQNGIRTVAFGRDMSLALKQPGPYNVVGFNGEVIGPASDSRPSAISTPIVTQVAAGRAHAIALQNDGRVVVWGDSLSGQLSVPQELASGGVKQVAAAGDYCMAVTLQGALYVWGDSTQDWLSKLVAVPKEARSNVIKVAAGRVCALALLSNGSVVVWGGTTSDFQLQAIPAAAHANVSDIAVDSYGCSAAIAILNNGSIVQWGKNSTNPKLENVARAAISRLWAGAVLKNGSLVMWPTSNGTAPVPNSQKEFARGLLVQGVAISDEVPYTGGLGSVSSPSATRERQSTATSLVLLENGTLVSVPYACFECNIPPAAQSGVIDMALGGLFYLAVTTNSATSTPIGQTSNRIHSASISFVYAMSATHNLTSNITLQHEFVQQLRAAMATYFNVSTASVALNVSSQSQSTAQQQAPLPTTRLLQASTSEQAQLTAPVNITATWQAGDTTTPAFLQQQVSQLEQQPAAALPAALIQTYGIGTSNVTINNLMTSNLPQAAAILPPPAPVPVQVQLPHGQAAAPPDITASGAANPTSKKNSKGTVAGITVGCVIGVAALATLAVVMYRRYHRASRNRGNIIPTMSGGFEGVAVPTEAVKIAGLPEGELFVLATAQNYSWTEATALIGPIQAVEAGVNDTQLDKMLQQEVNAQQAAAPSYCPAVQLSKDELRQQVQLLSDGLLGRGATALVFKCVWPSRFGPNALLAAKVLQNGFESDMTVLSSFAYEANLLAGIQHPHVVKLYGYCLDPPTVCLILELLPCSLKDVLYKAPPKASISQAASDTAPKSGSMSKHDTSKTLSSSGCTRTTSTSVPATLPGATDSTKQAPVTSASQTRSSSIVDENAVPREAVGGEVPSDGIAELQVDDSVASKSSVHPLKPVMLPQIVRMCTDIAAGLAYLHSQSAPAATVDGTGQRLPMTTTRDGRIVHRDMKPANILLNSQGVAKISDFGLARQHDHTTFATIHLGAGTLPYMAPELLISSKAGVSGAACTNRVDIYSLGIIMWELLMGQPPWRGMSAASIMAAVINRRRLPLPGDVQSEDREHAIMDMPLLQSLPAHSHPDLPKMCQIIQACWQQRELRRPTAAALHGTLSALLQLLEQQPAHH